MKTPEEFLEANGFVTAEKTDRQALITALLSEMEKGLRGEESSLRMIPTYVGVSGKVAAGTKVATLDAGGTNFRSAVVSIPPKIEDKKNQPMPGTKGLVDNETFYGAFAAEVKRVLPGATAKKVGFCFSYPAESTPALDAKVLNWTKGIEAPGIVGQYLGKELSPRIDGRPLAIVNDTVATLLAAKATEGDKTYSSYIGFILGTGTNAAYVERNSGIAKLSGLDPEGSMIINAESGNFDKFPRSAFDLALDKKQNNPGRQALEKTISGAYLGGIGLEIYKAAAKEGLFSAKAAAAVGGLGALETMDFDDFCANYRREGRANPLYAAFADADDAKMARRLGLPVFERAAVLTAIHLAAFCIKSGEGADASAPIAINADGSTYYKTKTIPFADVVRREMTEMLTTRRNIHFEFTPQVDDAPLVGAAIAALM